MHGRSRSEPRHRRQQVRSIQILNVDSSRQKLSIIRIFWTAEPLQLQGEKGLVGMEGKEYVVQDGDVILLFRFNDCLQAEYFYSVILTRATARKANVCARRERKARRSRIVWSHEQVGRQPGMRMYVPDFRARNAKAG